MTNLAFAKTVASILMVAALAACSGGAKKPDRFLTEKVAVGDLEKTVLGAGVLQPLEVVNVGAQASGQIQSLKVELGDKVKRGQLLAVIDPQNQENTLRNAEAALAVQKAQRASLEASLAQNQLSLKRQETLVKSGNSAPASFEQADAQVKVSLANMRASDAQIRQAEIAVEKAKVDLGRTNILAPIDGVIAEIDVREGQTVNSVQSAPTIVRIAKMDVMTVKAQISEADVINVHSGQKVYFTILGDPTQRYYGALRTVEPAPETTGTQANSTSFGAGSNAAVYYNALFDIPNPEGRLRAAMTAQVNIVLAEAKGVLTLPASALGKKDKDGLFPVKILNADGKTTTTQKVSIGLNNNVVAQVLSGAVKAGDKVVVGDSQAIKRQETGASVSVG